MAAWLSPHVDTGLHVASMVGPLVLHPLVHARSAHCTLGRHAVPSATWSGRQAPQDAVPPAVEHVLPCCAHPKEAQVGGPLLPPPVDDVAEDTGALLPDAPVLEDAVPEDEAAALLLVPIATQRPMVHV